MILIALDLRDGASRLIETAVAQVRAVDQVLLLHVAPEDPEYVEYRVGPEDARDEIARGLREARARLETEAARLRERGLEVDALVVQGPPAARIIDEAMRRRASLVVVGRGAHGRVHDAILGSVVEGVIRGAPCPVLVVPPADVTARCDR